MSCSEHYQPMLRAASRVAGEQWGAEQGTMEAVGGWSVAGSQGAEYNSRADICSMPFPLLWMCPASVLRETMASSWIEHVRSWLGRQRFGLACLTGFSVTVLFNDIFNRWGPSLSWVQSDSGFAEEAVCILRVGSSSLSFTEITWHICSYAYSTKGWKNTIFFYKECFSQFSVIPVNN